MSEVSRTKLIVFYEDDDGESVQETFEFSQVINILTRGAYTHINLIDEGCAIYESRKISLYFD